MNLRQFLPTIFFIAVLAMSVLGADRALVIGIDNYQTVSPTPGSVADANAMAAFIERKYKFSRSSIKVLTGSAATAKNIKDSIENWLIKETRPGDRVFLFYSGHGAQVDDDNGDERDELDEVLAPYDVSVGDKNTLPGNFIRDDEMNVFLVRLSGRRVVMAFDSCHSGTISRSLEPKSKFVALRNKFTTFETMRSFTDQESYIPKDAKSKDLYVVKEDFVDGKLNGIVIFSAATAYQKAMWLKDKSRGAFAYSFEKVQEKGGDFPTVSELNQRIKDYVVELKVKKLVETEQVPEMEIISQTRLEDKPLFAEIPSETSSPTVWQASVLTSLHNPLADFKVKINLGKTNFQVGEQINYSVEISGLKPDEKAYLYIMAFSRAEKCRKEDELVCQNSCDYEICTKYVASLFPTKAGNDFDNYLGNGLHNFPRKGRDTEYITEATEAGKDVFLAFVSKKKLNFGDRDTYSWSDTFRLIGLDSLQKQVEELTQTRSWQNRPQLKGGDWQADSVVVNVR